MQMLVINTAGFWETGRTPPPNVSGSMSGLYSLVRSTHAETTRRLAHTRTKTLG